MARFKDPCKQTLFWWYSIWRLDRERITWTSEPRKNISKFLFKWLEDEVNGEKNEIESNSQNDPCLVPDSKPIFHIRNNQLSFLENWTKILYLLIYTILVLLTPSKVLLSFLELHQHKSNVKLIHWSIKEEQPEKYEHKTIKKNIISPDHYHKLDRNK